MRRILRDLFSAIVLGLILLGISHAATRNPWGASTGYPLPYSYANLPCTTPNPYNGCGYSYNPLLVGLDYLFWLAVALALVGTFDTVWPHIGMGLRRKMEK